MWSGPYTAQGSEGFDIYKLFNEQKFLFFSDLFSYSQSMCGLHQFIAQRI